jgi:predicted regulator of Ras-like GTPase activity (Roadblock/LC7/MglB family)
MSELDQALRDLRRHEGVEHVLMLGRDGLLVQHLGDESLDVETATAMVPGIASACGSLGHASSSGEFTTAVIEFEAGVGIVLPLSSDLLLLVLLQSGIGFAPLLHELREQRDRLSSLV